MDFVLYIDFGQRRFLTYSKHGAGRLWTFSDLRWTCNWNAYDNDQGYIGIEGLIGFWVDRQSEIFFPTLSPTLSFDRSVCVCVCAYHQDDPDNAFPYKVEQSHPSSSLHTYPFPFFLSPRTYIHSPSSLLSLFYLPHSPPRRVMTTISTFTYIPSPLVADYAFPTPQYPYIPTKSSLSNILHPSEDQPIYSPLDDPVEQEEDHPTINEQRLIEMNEERFVEIYGQDLWAAFRDAQTVVVSDLSSGRRVGERMVQATISLIIATDDDREDSMGDQSSFELLLEILSAPEEDGGEWEMKNYSVTLDDKVC